MVLTDKEEISRLKGQMAEVRAEQKHTNEALSSVLAELKELKERLPPPPTPTRTTAPPVWTGSPNPSGLDYAGPPPPPSGARTGGFGSYRKETRPDGAWRDPFGQWRSQTGELVTPRSVAPVRGPQRDPGHQQAIDLLDRTVERTTP